MSVPVLPVIVVRPQPGCKATVEALRGQGFAAHGFPLFTVIPLDWEVPAPDRFDALLIGSANVFRHGGPGLAQLHRLPVLAVGESTADAARDAGFAVAAVGAGGLQTVFDEQRGAHRRLLRLAGRARVDLLAPVEVSIAEREVYASEPQPLPDDLAAMLREPAVVLLHSAEAARHLAAECDRLCIDRRNLSLATIGPRVAVAAGSGWGRVELASRADEAAMLALTAEMCQGRDRPKKEEPSRVPMQDDNYSYDKPAAPPPRRTVRTTLIVSILAFVAGAGLVGWLASQDMLIPDRSEQRARAEGQAMIAAPRAQEAAAPGVSSGTAEARPYGDPLSTVETRLALLEERLSRVDSQADAASGNAARAEGLLVAFAARRLIDRGEQLGYLEDQLRLRFANAQPLAVDTVISFSRQPVTLDGLATRLAVMAPDLTDSDTAHTGWARVRAEVASLFEVRRDSSASRRPQDRVARARMLLANGRTAQAVEEVQRLPNPEAAEEWIGDARRYAAAQRALDLIETTAMLEPQRLKDSGGRTVDQPSPLASPPGSLPGPAPSGAAGPGFTTTLP